MNEGGLDRRNMLKAAIGAAAASTMLGSTAEAADKRAESMTGAERLDALENEAAQLLTKIRELKQYKLQSEAGRAVPDMSGLSVSQEIAQHAEKIGRLMRGAHK